MPIIPNFNKTAASLKDKSSTFSVNSVKQIIQQTAKQTQVEVTSTTTGGGSVNNENTEKEVGETHIKIQETTVKSQTVVEKDTIDATDNGNKKNESIFQLPKLMKDISFKSVNEEQPSADQDSNKSAPLSLFDRITSKQKSTISEPEPMLDDPNAEDVYIVLRPINFKLSSVEMLQRIGEATEMAQLEQWLLLQHWGIMVGGRYYHLHIVDEKDEKGVVSQKLAVSLSKFETLTIKFPIWQTTRTHKERVQRAISTIKGMGNYVKENDVPVFEDIGDLHEQLMPEEVRKEYYSESEYKRALPMAFTGKYNAVTNSCINFTARFMLEHVFQFNPTKIDRQELRRNMTWVAYKWASSGCKIKPAKLIKMFTSPMGLLNPLRTLSRTSDGNIFLIRLLLVFMGKITTGGTTAPVSPEKGISTITTTEESSTTTKTIIIENEGDDDEEEEEEQEEEEESVDEHLPSEEPRPSGD